MKNTYLHDIDKQEILKFDKNLFLILIFGHVMNQLYSILIQAPIGIILNLNL